MRSMLSEFPGSQSLEELELNHVAMGKDDLHFLGHLTETCQLPILKTLDLSRNILEGMLSGFTGSQSLQNLRLDHASLNKDDTCHLNHLIETSQLPRLQHLTLSGNTLTGMLSGFTGSQSLEQLRLDEAALNKDDMYHLTCQMKNNKLPQLKVLSLHGNKLCDMEDELVELVQTCITHHQRVLQLWLAYNNLSKDLKEKLKRRREGTKIRLKFQ